MGHIGRSHTNLGTERKCLISVRVYVASGQQILYCQRIMEEEEA